MKLSWAEYRIYFNERLAELRKSAQIPFDSYLDPSRIQFDLSVLPQYRGVLKPVSVSGLEAKA